MNTQYIRAEPDGWSTLPSDVLQQAASTTVKETVLGEVKTYFEQHEDEFPFEAPSEEFVADHFFSFDYLDGRREVEREWVAKPFAYVSILFEEERNEYRYHVSEPDLDKFEEYVRQDLVTILRDHLIYQNIDRENDRDRETVFVEQAEGIIRRNARTVEVGTLHKLLYYLKRDFLRNGPIDPIMRDRDIEDISCDGTDVPVYVYHHEYRDLETNIAFDRRSLDAFIVKLAQRSGKSISVSDPLVDASLPDGSRLQLTLGNDISTRGSTFTIRKFADIPYTPIDLINWNTFSVEEMAYYWLAIENNKSLIFAGGTGSGKTTSLNAVSFFIPPGSKTVTIENTREIDLPHENWIPLLTRESTNKEARGEVTMFNLLQSALRQRPEYLLVGEIRTQERVALTFFQAMSTGHTSYTTLHADTIETVLSRLQNPPLNVPSQMIQELDIVSVQRQTFLDDNRVRRNNVIWELSTDEEDPRYIGTNQIFQWKPDDDEHEQVGESGLLDEIAWDRGWDEAELEAELSAREDILQYMVDNEILDYEAVSSIIHAFHRNQELVLEQMASGELDYEKLEEEVDEAVSEAIKTHDEVTGTPQSEEANAREALGDKFETDEDLSLADVVGAESESAVSPDDGGTDRATDTDEPGDSP
jgi:flagellar protein FlaI